MTLRKHWCCPALGTLALACGDDSDNKGAQGPADAAVEANATVDAPEDSFPGHDPPPLDALVEAAKARSAPQEDASSYDPRQVDVPEIKPVPAQVLPAANQGLPLLVHANGVGLVYDADLSDPITAAGTCMQLATGCVDHVSVEDGRDRDSCLASVATCRTNHPWDENEPCCPESCKDLYAALRGEAYSQAEAWVLTRDSDCFPSTLEFMEAARERDRKARED
jgi:hypothetical protein